MNLIFCFIIGFIGGFFFSTAISVSDKTQTVSPDEVRGVGKWIVLEPEIDLRSCSVCEHMVIRADCNYCPNCGARMGGVQDALS